MPKQQPVVAAENLGACTVWAISAARSCSFLPGTRDQYPCLDVQNIYPFTEEGAGEVVADAMAMMTVKSTIVPWPELVQ
jgi:hypothetical protein